MAQRQDLVVPDAQLTPWDKAWATFLLDGKGAVTRENYRIYAKKIDQFRLEEHIFNPDDFTDELEEHFLRQFAAKTTAWTYQKVLRAFFAWCEKRGLRDHKYLAKRIQIEEIDEPLTLIDYTQLNHLLDKAKGRDKALLLFTFDTMARASEVRYAKIENYHRDTREFVIDQRKVGTYRRVHLTQTLVRELNRYIKEDRPPQVNRVQEEQRGRVTAQPWLFLTTRLEQDALDYKQLSKAGLASIFRRLRFEMGWTNGTLSPQLLRRGRATQIAIETKDRYQLMKLGGWKSITSTRRYYRSTTEQDIALLDKIERERDAERGT
jgi:integrase